MVYESHNNAIFTRGIVWEIRFKNPSEITNPVDFILKKDMEKLYPVTKQQSKVNNPLLLNPEAEKQAADFLGKFAEMCEIVSKEKILEKERLAELTDLSKEELEEKSGLLQKNIDALIDLVTKFKEMMKKFNKNEGEG